MSVVRLPARAAGLLTATPVALVRSSCAAGLWRPWRAASLAVPVIGEA